MPKKFWSTAMLNNFRQLALTQPEAPALMGAKGVLSYQRLLERVEQIACQIRREGHKQSCIAIALADKSEEVLYALAALYSGNYFFFVPHEIKDDFQSQLPVALFFSDLPQFEDVSILPFSPADTLATNVDNFAWQPICEPSPHEFFCVFVTSGSTGLAKYVVHDFQSIAEDTARQVEANGLSPVDRVDFLFAASFSSSLASIFPTFCAGATLVVHDMETSGLADIPDFWAKYGITFTTLTSSAFRSICRLAGDLLPQKTSTIRFLCLGGEPVVASDADLIRAYFPQNIELQLAYASTETRTIAAVTFRPAFDSIPGHDGFPVRKKSVTLLNERGEACELGQTGEIVVKSAHISVGYFRENTLHPHPVEGNLRVYCTGDRGMLREDGSLLLSGRVHAQQKVNGKLVDFAQLELAISLELPAGSHCKILKLADPRGSEVLVAFLCGKQHVDEELLRSKIALREEFAVKPRRYVWMEEFPLNAHGKIDSAALGQEGLALFDQTVETKHDDPLIQRIKAAWSAELGLEINNLDADFFTALGGTSMGAEIVLQEISEYIGRDLDATLLQELRSVRRLANYLKACEQKSLPFLEIWTKSQNDDACWVIFLDTGHHDSFEHVRASLTKLDFPFPTACLRLDFYGILSHQNFEKQFDRWSDRVSGLTVAGWVGVSFNGWLAAKFAEKHGGSAVLFDTICYGYYDPSEKMNFWKTRLNFLKNTWDSRSPLRSVQAVFTLVKSHLTRKYRPVAAAPSPYLSAVELYLKEGSSPQHVAGILYFYATKSLYTSSRDIAGWREKSPENFIIRKLEGDHLDGCSPSFAPEVGAELVRFFQRMQMMRKLE
ncbi:non-ribosomal peptide synthetase [Algoriphagus namhaensis]